MDWPRRILVVSTFIVGFVAGWGANHAFSLLPLLETMGLYSRVNERISAKQVVDVIPAADDVVVLVIGQSNAANSVEPYLRVPRESVLDFWGGRFFIGEAPLLGASGEFSSIWLAVADELLDRGQARRIVLVNVAVGATSIEYWVDGYGAHRIKQVYQNLAVSGIQPDVIAWVQGEQDNEEGTDQAEYGYQLTQLMSRFHEYWPEAPVIAALSTRCRLLGPNAAIRQAVVEVADQLRFVRKGPDLDQFGPSYRYDGCHYSAKGVPDISAEWVQAIEHALSKSANPQP